MADNYRNKAEQNELAQDDPFAELTRIMGHDPRSTSQHSPSEAESAESLALDLENELIGHIAEEGEAAGPVEEVEETADARVFEQQWLPESTTSTDEPEFESRLEALLDETFTEHGAAGGEFSGNAERGYPEEQAPVSQDDDMATFEAELASAASEAVASQPASMPWHEEPRDYGADEAEGIVPEPDHADGAAEVESEIPFDYAKASAGFSELRSGPEADFSVEGNRAEPDPAAWSEEAFAIEEHSQSDGWQAGQDDGAGEPSQAENAYAEMSAAEPEIAAEENGGEPNPAMEWPEEAFAFDDQSQSDGWQAGQHDGAGEPTQSENAYAELPAAEPEFAAEENQPEVEPAGAWLEEAFALEEQPQAHEWQAGQNDGAGEPASYESSYVETAAAQPDYVAEENRGEADTAGTWPVAAFAAGDQSQGNDWQTAQDHGEDVMAPRRESTMPPEIETVEVQESAVAVADNLDIPEVRYRDEVKPAAKFDEIEEILAGAFGEAGEPSGEVWAETSAPAAEQVYEPQAANDEDDYFAADIAAAAGIGAAGYASQVGQGSDDHGRDYRAGGNDPMSLTPAPGTEPPPRSRRLPFGSPLLVAAVVGGVVVLGGATLFALSFGGGGDGEPTVIAADNSPVKVKPENPGGVQIPNQDNQVYKRVSGEEAGNARPAQAELISTTEEPVNLALPGVQPDSLRLPREGSAANSERTDVAERLSGTSVEGSASQDETVSLTPRRVRSMVVRPDGTMVPRDMPEPAEPTQTAAVSENSETAAATAEAGTVGAQPESNGNGTQLAAPLQGSATQEQAAGTAGSSTPRTAPIPPSRPSNIAARSPQQPAQPAGNQEAQASAQQQQQVAAVANPPAQAATAASAWSVQIASQPTAEDAQASYQQLAQRFGSMLQGKGVNIVKADIEGKGTFYRVRIPSPSKDEAIQLCSQLKSAGGNCFVSQ